MEIVVGKTSGFCYGVKNAVAQTRKTLEETNPVYCLGELIHNKQVVEELQNQGLKVIDHIDQVPDQATCISRAHGIEKAIYEKAKEKGLNLIDLTCPKVMLIHKKAEEYAKQDYFILLFGIHGHAETIGNASFCGEKYAIVETKQDLQQAINRIQETNQTKVAILSQTTFGVEQFAELVEELKMQLGENTQIQIDNTICNSTNLRQKETGEIASKVECMLILGGKHSSNTRHLYEIAKHYVARAFHIENEAELPIEELKQYKIIGLMAGASTPEETIQNTLKILRKL